MSIWKRYSAWSRRQVSTAQCGPFVMVLAIAVTLAAVIVIYHRVILDTLALAGKIAAAGAGAYLAYRILKAVIRWHLHRERKPLDDVDGAPHTIPGYVEQDTQSLPVLDTVPEDSQDPLAVPADAATKTASPAAIGSAAGQMADEADKLSDTNLELIWTKDGQLAARKN